MPDKEVEKTEDRFHLVALLREHYEKIVEYASGPPKELLYVSLGRAIDEIIAAKKRKGSTRGSTTRQSSPKSELAEVSPTKEKKQGGE